MTMDDADRVLAWRNLPEVADTMFTNERIERDSHLSWMSRTLDSDASRYWIIQHDGRDVGVANLADISERHGRCAWAFYLGEQDVPGPVGLAVEFEIMAIAFADLGLHKLISEVLSTNERVIRLHEHVGFVREGTLRDHIRRADGWHDVVVLSMLEDEWRARHARRARS